MSLSLAAVIEVEDMLGEDTVFVVRGTTYELHLKAESRQERQDWILAIFDGSQSLLLLHTLLTRLYHRFFINSR